METFVRDLRYGLRGLRRSPGLAAVAVLSLGLGIGANTTAFTWMDRFVFRPLPAVEGVDRLVTVNTRAPAGDEWSVSVPAFRDWQAQSRSLDLAAYTLGQLGLREGEGTVRVWAAGVSANFFDVLGVRPTLGRGFVAGEDREQAPLVVLGHDYWLQHFGGDSAMIGRPITLNGVPMTVIGVAPPRFTGAVVGLRFDLYVPLGMRHVLLGGADPSAQRGWQFLDVVGRIRPGFTFVQARDELDAVAKRASEAAGSGADRLGAVVKHYTDEGAPEFLGPVLLALLGVTGVILLIACVNVANLLLARAAVRQREVAIRLAVGAGRLRLVRQLLTESLVLALLAGLAGLLLSLWMRDLLVALVPQGPYPIAVAFDLNPRVLAFALAVTLTTALVFGLVPAVQASRPNLVPALKDDIGSAPGPRGRLQSTLVVAQVALSLVTLVCAGLFIRSLASSRNVETGFSRPEGVLLVSTDLSLAGYRDTTGIPVVRRLLEAARAVPGAETVSLASDVPLGFSGGSSMSLSVSGYTLVPGENMSINYYQVAGDYFRVMQTPIVRGRPLTDEDRRGAPRVAVVNETFVRRFLAHAADPLGQTFDYGRGPVTIVGVARDGKYRQLTEAPKPFVWYAYEQSFPRDFSLHVRTTGDPAALVPAMRRAFAAASADLPFLDPRTLEDETGAAVFAQRVGAYLLGAFGLLALLLSAIGIHGVMGYTVSRRTREIGVRMALGADHREVVAMVLRRSMRLVSAGLGVGAVGAVGAGLLLRSQLLGVKPWDPVTFGAILATLAAVALFASWLPARRAARVDPLVALRYE